ncbi:MAG: phosphoglucosamine mutase [Chitinophagales bacterium]
MALIKSISGIRGTIGNSVGNDLTPIDLVKFTAAYGTHLLQSLGHTEMKKAVVIGRDARISGQMVNNIVVGALQSVGIHVIDIGLATTPTVEMAVTAENAIGGIILSASHNPKEWNALKLLNEKGEFLSKEAGEQVLQIAESGTFQFVDVDEVGSYTFKEDYLSYHIAQILQHELVDVAAISSRSFKIVVDAVNSVGGFAVPTLLKALGVEDVFELYCEPTGRFPHNPEPLPEHLSAISNEVKRQNADLGIVVDPDVDRLALVCEDGEMFGEEYTLVAVADYVLKHRKGSTVSNLSSTKALKEITEKAGQKYYAAAVGEVNVVAQMKAVDAVIGGEGNGGIIVPDLHYGRDALIGIALFLSYLAKFGESCSMLRSSYPTYHISKNKIQLTPDINVDVVLERIAKKYKNYPQSTIDGLKLIFDGGDWVHLRKSNTEPIIRIYSESNLKTTAESMANRIMQDIREISKE